MINIDFSPEAINDLEELKDYLNKEFGSVKEQEVLRDIFKDIKKLVKYPNIDIKLFERFGIVTDYKCFYTHKNYVFYRFENNCIKIVRILDEKRDFLYVLCGISMRSDESRDYWGE